MSHLFLRVRLALPAGLVLPPEVLELERDLVVEHGAGQEEGEVHVHVIRAQEVLDGGKAVGVVVNGEVGREEGAELDQRVLALRRENS